MDSLLLELKQQIDEGRHKEYTEEEEELYSGLIHFLQSTPDFTEKDVSAWANENGYHIEEVKTRIRKLLQSLLAGVGKSNHIPDEEFDQDQLEHGIEVEMEHTNNPLIAKMIAKDHLHEISDYYSRLSELENEAKEEGEYNEPETGEDEIDDDSDFAEYDISESFIKQFHDRLKRNRK